MERFIEYKKLSKKAQKAANAAKRNTWGLNPVSRIVESKKVYKRINNKQINWDLC